MRKTIFLLAFVLVFACNKDDNTGDTSNSFTYQGTSYELNNGLIWITNLWFKIELYSPGIEMTAGITGVEPEYSGAGDCLFFGYMIPSTSGEISEGEYTYSVSNVGPFTFSEGFIAIGLDLIDYSYTVARDINGGTVNVQKDEENWVIDFDLLLDDGETLTGNFTGDIHIWDDTIEDWI